MTEHTDNNAERRSADWLWLIAGVLVLVGGFVAFYALKTLPVSVRYVAVIAGIGLSAVSLAMTGLGRQTWEFALGSRVELRKMVWPTVKQAQMTTVVVLIFVVVLGVFFWLVDMLLGYITRSLLGAGG
ncbi:MAG: preprotein translocase subunit SecE [Pseudomonadota bacterium]|jgi:preprotein translocase subunit SecE